MKRKEWTKPQVDPFKLRSPDRQEYLDLFESMVLGPVGADEDYVDGIPTLLALHIPDLAKQAPWPRGSRGAAPEETYAKSWTVAWARGRKKTLEQDEQMDATNALLDAGDEASEWMRQRLHTLNPHADSPLSPDTIRDAMQRKNRRR